jgi:Insertion element 4 transposase N-terminal/Transposase DDE domain
MTRQGRCVLRPDESGRILDRLAGLEKIIAPSLVRQVLFLTKRCNQRACTLTHEVMMWVVMAMGILADLPIREVFRHARRLRKDEDTPHRSSLCVARQRLGAAPLRRLFQEVVRPLATADTPGAFYRGLRLMGIDGTVMDLPDTSANEKTFGRPSGGARGDGAFPQIRKLSLVELGTHVEAALQIKPCTVSEQAMVPSLLHHLTPDMLLIWDRNFFSYNLWKTLNSREIKVLARVKTNLVLRPLAHLSDGSYLAKIYPNEGARRNDREGIVVRVIRYNLDDPQRVGHDQEHVLLTNLLDEKAFPAAELICGYHERWEHELVYDEQKTHLDPRRATKPAHLRSETPAGVIQEVYALSLGHFVVRALMFQAAQKVGLDPDRLSFTGCFHILQCRLPECDARTPQSFQQWCESLLWELARERTEPRRNRINPRVIKRKMSKWLKKRPQHRHPSRLTKTFAESVVMVT